MLTSIERQRFVIKKWHGISRYRNGDDFKLKLNHVRTYPIAHTVNTAETVVELSSPFAVFLSNDCNPVNRQGVWKHMFEQLPPTSGTDTA